MGSSATSRRVPGSLCPRMPRISHIRVWTRQDQRVLATAISGHSGADVWAAAAQAVDAEKLISLMFHGKT